MVKGHKDAIEVIEVKLKILEKENDTKMLKEDTANKNKNVNSIMLKMCVNLFPEMNYVF